MARALPTSKLTRLSSDDVDVVGAQVGHDEADVGGGNGSIGPQVSQLVVCGEHYMLIMAAEAAGGGSMSAGAAAAAELLGRAPAKRARACGFFHLLSARVGSMDLPVRASSSVQEIHPLTSC